MKSRSEVGEVTGFEKLESKKDDNAGFEQDIDDVIKEVKELLLRKRNDYGTENISRFGELGVVIRLSDKLDRLVNLVVKPKLSGKGGNAVNNEPVDDTWLDIIGYGILGLLQHRQLR